MSGEVYKTEAEYEAMPIEELNQIKDLDLRYILQRVFGLDSVVYFIDKVQKLRYISQPDQRPIVLDEGEQKRARHREMNKENRIRPRGDVEERMEEETRDRVYRCTGSVRHDEAVQDDFTGRSVKNVYLIEDVADGTAFRVSRGTARWLVEKNRLEEFEVTKGRQSVAHAAGKKSAADLLGDGEVHVPKVKAPAPVEEDHDDDVEEVADGAAALEEDELDEILNSLPS